MTKREILKYGITIKRTNKKYKTVEERQKREQEIKEYNKKRRKK